MSTSPRQRTAQQLPSGRHGLPRSYIIHNQRERILHAVVIVAARQGYGAMTIEEVVAVAGVSRRTYYDHFSNKEEGFLAAYDLVVEQVAEVVTAAFTSGATWPERIRRGVGAFLEHLAAEPDLAHLCVVEILAAGPRALERRTSAMRRFHSFFLPDEEHASEAGPDAPLAAEAAIGGLYEIVYGRVLTHQTEELPELLPALIRSLLLPFVGRPVADAEYRAAAHHVELRRQRRETSPAA